MAIVTLCAPALAATALAGIAATGPGDSAGMGKMAGSQGLRGTTTSVTTADASPGTVESSEATHAPKKEAVGVAPGTRQGDASPPDSDPGTRAPSRHPGARAPERTQPHPQARAPSPPSYPTEPTDSTAPGAPVSGGPTDSGGTSGSSGTTSTGSGDQSGTNGDTTSRNTAYGGG